MPLPIFVVLPENWLDFMAVLGMFCFVDQSSILPSSLLQQNPLFIFHFTMNLNDWREDREQKWDPKNPSPLFVFDKYSCLETQVEFPSLET